MLSGVEAYTGSVYGYEKTTGTDQLGKDAFLQLLITELRYQDPLNPMTDREFISQMAQFSALEQMQNLYRVGQAQQAISLIGRPVLAEEYLDDGISEMIYGQVTGVRTVNGKTLLRLDSGREIEADSVVVVLDETGLEQYLQAMVGRKAYVRVYNEAGEVVDLREIQITGYKIVEGKPYVTAGSGENEEQIPLSEIWSVA